MVVTTAITGASSKERAVAFVRFDHHVFALAHARARAGVIHAPAHDKVGSRPAAARTEATMRSGGGLAVRAGDGDAEFQAHQLGQHFRARDHRNFQAVRFDHLDVVLRHGGGNHHHVRAVRHFRRDGPS